MSHVELVSHVEPRMITGEIGFDLKAGNRPPQLRMSTSLILFFASSSIGLDIGRFDHRYFVR